ncbi:sulfatase-like hydrolase/transferase [Actinosynnema sp. NPDC050436]|uniref:sulfatase-like hydrolase/transferase n=1 Tax=Actinosynnema sp. NPDC050436 TaxID=3155659 RepID=UPI0033C34218
MGGWRRGGRWVGTGFAVLVVVVVLLAPGDLERFSWSAFLRVPVEALLGVVLVLVLPARWRRGAAWAGGVCTGLLAVVKVLDIGFDVVLYRPFDLVLDWPLLGPAVDYVAVTAGTAGAVGAVAGAVLVAVALVALVAWSVARLARLADRRRLLSTRLVLVLAAAWITFAGTGLPIASTSAARFVYDHARDVRAGLGDRDAFAAEAAVDAFRDVPGDRLLTALRGKRVLLVFVESYGRSAVEDPGLRPDVLDGAGRRVAAAGFSARSGFLTSPTAGGGSWLAQATLLSGLRVDNQQRYRNLVGGDRLTLGGAFRRAGWRTVGVMPGITQAWPEGAFFGYRRIMAAADLGYRGPRFGYATTPDQFTLAALDRAEGGSPEPVMATVALVGSHAPWTPVPAPVAAADLGDGSVYRSMASGADEPGSILTRDPAQVRADYRRSLEYSLGTLVSYVEDHRDDDLVLVLLGDHQPAQVVTGGGAGRDVPVGVVARDPAVVDRLAGWGWTPGPVPEPHSPTWPMESFRDRFLTAFG